MSVNRSGLFPRKRKNLRQGFSPKTSGTNEQDFTPKLVKTSGKTFRKNPRNSGDTVGLVALSCETQQGTDQVLKIEHLLRG